MQHEAIDIDGDVFLLHRGQNGWILDIMLDISKESIYIASGV